MLVTAILRIILRTVYIWRIVCLTLRQFDSCGPVESVAWERLHCCRRARAAPRRTAVFQGTHPSWQLQLASSHSWQLDQNRRSTAVEDDPGTGSELREWALFAFANCSALAKRVRTSQISDRNSVLDRWSCPVLTLV